MNTAGKPDRLDDRLPDSNKVRQRIEAFILLLSLYCLVIVMLAFCVYNARADDEIGLAGVTRGSLLFKGDDAGRYRPAPMLHTDVTLDVSGLIVRAKLRQEFRNDGNDWVEGIYAFPLPEDAAVDHMRMEIGTRVIEGQIKEREAAKRSYDAAKQAGRKAALIEQERPNLFTNSIANIGPKEHVIVEIEYQQVLRYDAGRFTLRFPMAITPRYIPGAPLTNFGGLGWARDTGQVPDASRITPPIWRDETAINPVSITLHLNAGFPVTQLESPYHAVIRNDVDLSNGIVEVTLADGQVPADRDFELSWRPSAGRVPKAALFRERLGSESYYLLMVLPPQGDTHVEQTLSREVIYVIDTSGSMAGTSIRQAKEALILALGRLRPGDRFNVIAFNSSTDRLFNDTLPAGPYNLRRAREYVENLNAGGGTEMYPALKAALDHQHERNGVRQVIFLTDGAVGNETTLFHLIQRRLGDSRLFTVGIGSAPNSHFMSKAAEFGRGTFTYIGDVSQVRSRMETLFQKLESPLMTDLSVDAGNAPMEMYPRHIPDLYQGEPLVATFKSDAGNRQLLLGGRRLRQTWRNSVSLDHATRGKGIGVLWARRKIAALMDTPNTDTAGRTIRQQVIDVALQHHLVSKYTSLVAIDITPSRPYGEGIDSQAVPVNLPHGQVREKIFGHYPKTATTARLNLLLGTLLLLGALLLHRKRTA